MLAAIVDHLWQSTLFVALMALLAFALRRNSARIRYWLWFAASVKFLIPFSAFVSIGATFYWNPVSDIAPAFSRQLEHLRSGVRSLGSPSVEASGGEPFLRGEAPPRRVQETRPFQK